MKLALGLMYMILPEMAFDHKEIIEKGLEHLRKTLDYDIVGSNLHARKIHHERFAKSV